MLFRKKYLQLLAGMKNVAELNPKRSSSNLLTILKYLAPKYDIIK